MAKKEIHKGGLVSLSDVCSIEAKFGDWRDLPVSCLSDTPEEVPTLKVEYTPTIMSGTVNWAEGLKYSSLSLEEACLGLSIFNKETKCKNLDQLLKTAQKEINGENV